MDKVYDNQREAILVGYLAGILDGEGSVSLKKTTKNTNRKTPAYEGAITIGMAEEEIIKLIVNRYGGTYRVECVQGRKPIYRYAKVGTKGVIEILKELTPYLIEKKKRAEVLMEYYEAIDNTAYRNELGQRLPMSDSEIDKREEFYLRMKELNTYRAPATTNRDDTREGEVIV